MASRTPPSSTSIVLVSQANPLHAHQARQGRACRAALHPRRLVDDETRRLGDGEHEHQVEEQFERRDGVLVIAAATPL